MSLGLGLSVLLSEGVWLGLREGRSLRLGLSVGAALGVGLGAGGKRPPAQGSLEQLLRQIERVSGLDAAGVRAAVGLASANLDTQLGPLATGVTLANGAHGGSSTVITAKRVVIANTTNGETALDVSATGTGNAHAVRLDAAGGGAALAVGAAQNAVSITSSAASAVLR